MNLVYIHIGNNSILPKYSYIYDSIEQAKRFNNNNIYVIANEKELVNFDDSINKIPAEELENKETLQFLNVASFMDNRDMFGDFWFVTAKRLFILECFMRKYNKTQVVHMEYDNTLYVNLDDYDQLFRKFYKDIVAVCPVSNTHVAANFMYVDTANSIKCVNDNTIEILKSNTNKNISEMEVLRQISNIHPDILKMLPVLPVTDGYSDHLNDFNSIFDGLPLGQFVGGINRPIIGNSTLPGKQSIWPGWVVGEELKNDNIKIVWENDPLGRNCPFIIDINNKKWKVNNLHVHCKKLKLFC